MIKPLNYKINKVNKELFLYHTASDARDSMKKLLDNIIHISYDTFIQQIKNNLDEVIPLKLEDRPIFVYIDDNDINKSTFWVYMHIEQFLNEKKIKTKIIYNLKEVLDDDIVLLVDDCIYSGNQMTLKINNLLTDKESKLFKLFLFVPYMSLEGKLQILLKFKFNMNYNFKFKFFITKYIEILPLKNYLTFEEAKNIFKYYNISYNDVLGKYLIYFDHKVADDISTFPQIFNGLVPNQKNKEIQEQKQKIKNTYFIPDNEDLLIYLNSDQLKKLKKQDYDEYMEKTKQLEDKLDNFNTNQDIKIKELEKELDFFPLLTNCEHIEKNINFINSSCPIPPYKKEYPDFLKKVNEINKLRIEKEREQETILRLSLKIVETTEITQADLLKEEFFGGSYDIAILKEFIKRII